MMKEVSKCLPGVCRIRLLQKQDDGVSRNLSRVIEINVLYPVLGGDYKGVCSNISTSLKFS